MAQATATDLIQMLYVAYFNRPADPAGLAYWQGVVGSDTTKISLVAASFAATPEYTATFKGMTNDAIVNTIYHNLFNRVPDIGGLNYWSGLLSSGTISVSDIVQDVALSAVNSTTVGDTDHLAITNKVAGAEAFTAYLNTDVNLRLSYSTPAAAAIGSAYLATITDPTTLANASSTAALGALGTSLVTAGQPVGTTFALTIGQDIITGTASNDTINTFLVDNTGTVVSTLAAYDTIDGGAGVDTLNLSVAAGINDTQVGTIKNVELINITGSDLLQGTTATAGTFEADFYAGATKITVDGIATTVDHVSSQTIVFAANSAAAADAVTYTATATAGSIGVTNTSGTITVSGAKLASLALTGSTHHTAGAADVLTIDGTAATLLKTLTVGVTNTSEIDITTLSALTSIDASASTGGVTLDGVATTVATITTGTGDDVVALNTALSSTVTTASVSTGAGDDTITVAVTGTGTYSVNAGAGDDTIIMSPATAMATGDKIDGGDGNDTLQFNNAGTVDLGVTTLLASVVSNVETLEFANALTTVDGSQLTQFKTLAFDAASTITNASEALVAHANLSATAVGYALSSSNVATYTGTVNVTEDSASVVDGVTHIGTSTVSVFGDSAVVTVEAATGSASSVTSLAGDLKTSLTVTTTNGVDDASTPTADVLATTNITIGATHTGLGNLSSVVLNGNGSVIVNASGSSSHLTSIDASSLGGTLHYGVDKDDITGGLTFTGNAANAETIKLGAGADVLHLASTVSVLDTVTGFDTTAGAVGTTVTDKLDLDGGTTVIDGSVAGQVVKMTLASGDTSLNLAFTHAAAVAAASVTAGNSGVIQFTFAGDTYLFEDNPAAGNTAGHLDATDFAVKLTGTVDLSTAFGVHV